MELQREGYRAPRRSFKSEQRRIYHIMRQLYPGNKEVAEMVLNAKTITEIERIQVNARNGRYDRWK